MPVVYAANPLGETVKRYDWPANRFEWTAGMASAVRDVRSEAGRTLQAAAYIKDIKREQLRIQRAADLAVRLIEGGVGAHRNDLWPVELASELDWIASVMENTDGR